MKLNSIFLINALPGDIVWPLVYNFFVFTIYIPIESIPTRSRSVNKYLHPLKMTLA